MGNAYSRRFSLFLNVDKINHDYYTFYRSTSRMFWTGLSALIMINCSFVTSGM